MIPRNDLLPPNAPDGLEVLQLTSGGAPAAHVYPEAQIFSPDSRRFLLHDGASAHGADTREPRHRYIRCDIDDGCSLHPLIEEPGAKAPSVSPDGRDVYYFVDETTVNGGRLMLKRVGLDGTDRRELLVVDGPVGDTGRRPSLVGGLSTIRSDGKALAVRCFLGDGRPEGILWGLMVFDLTKGRVDVPVSGDAVCNMHPQYCRSSSPACARDILYLENHGCVSDAFGNVSVRWAGRGNDIHVVRDDGSQLRDMPWGRDGEEVCQGHFCWRGDTDRAIDSTWGVGARTGICCLLEGRAAPHDGHLGARTPGGQSNDLTAEYPKPPFLHFATDAQGTRLIADTTIEYDGEGMVHLATLDEPGRGPAHSWTRIAAPRSSRSKEAHLHPFLSPDGSMAFINSDESGVLQAYMVAGLERL